MKYQPPPHRHIGLMEITCCLEHSSFLAVVPPQATDLYLFTVTCTMHLEYVWNASELRSNLTAIRSFLWNSYGRVSFLRLRGLDLESVNPIVTVAIWLRHGCCHFCMTTGRRCPLSPCSARSALWRSFTCDLCQ